MTRLCTTFRGAVNAARAALLPALLLPTMLVLAACGGDEAEKTPETPKEVYDVPPALEIPTEDDPQEPPRRPSLSGRLPAGFPSDLPLVLPSSLIDYGQGEDGRPWVDVMTMSSQASVEKEMRRLVREAGWSGDLSDLRHGERQVRLELRPGQPGTVMRIFY